MSLTQNWKRQDYLNHIINNNLHNIWASWCNPKSTNGIRLAAYTPIYPENDNVDFYDRKCTAKNCTGTKTVPPADRTNRIINSIVCPICGSYKQQIYRWISASDRTKLWFNNPETVRRYGYAGRAFYATSIIYQNQIVNQNRLYTDESLFQSATLWVDIDIKKGKGTICDQENRDDLQKSLNILREELDTFVPKSYNLQTSGNGIYILINHNLVTQDIMNTLAKFNAWIRGMNLKLKSQNITRIKLDPINMPSRVFKLVGSIHQSKDLVAIPLPPDINISTTTSDTFKLKNFNINNFVDQNTDPNTNKLKFYDRCDISEIKSLYQYLEEYTEKNIHSDIRAIRYDPKIATEIITDQQQETDDEYQRRLNLEADIYIDRISFKQFQCDIPGRILYRKTNDGYEIEMLGVQEKDVDTILDKFYDSMGV